MKLFETNIRGRLLMAVGGAALLSACNVTNNFDIDEVNTALDFTGTTVGVGSGSVTGSSGDSSSSGGYGYDEEYWDTDSDDDNDLNFDDASDFFSGSGGPSMEVRFDDGSGVFFSDGGSQTAWEADPDDGSIVNSSGSATAIGSIAGGTWYYNTGTRDGEPISYYLWEENYTSDPQWMALIIDDTTDEVVDIWATPSEGTSASLPSGAVSYSGSTVTILRDEGETPYFGTFSLNANFAARTANISIDAGIVSLGGTALKIDPGTGVLSGDLTIYNGDRTAPGAINGKFSGGGGYYFDEGEVSGIYYDTISDSPDLVGGFVGSE